MSPMRICFFTFLLFVGIAVQFAVCFCDECDQPTRFGSDPVCIGMFERLLILANNDTSCCTVSQKNSECGFKTIKRPKNKFQCSISAEEIARMLFVPGTKWCGRRNRAKNYDDLGIFNETDACCREHDHCTNSIAGNSIKCNLNNNGFSKRNHCSCDDKFRKCLKNAKDDATNYEKSIIFDVLALQCFTCVCPTNDPKEDCGGGCKKYAWRDNPRSCDI